MEDTKGEIIMDILDLDQEVNETQQDNPVEEDIAEEETVVEEEIFIDDELPDDSEPEKEETGKKAVLSDRLLLVGIILGAIVIVIAGIKLISMTMDYRKGDKVYDTVREVVIKDEPQKGIPKPDKDKTEDPEVEKPWYQSIVVDMDELKQINSDAVGWIHFENEDISYPIVRGKDNDTYIHTAFTGEQVSAGSIFMDVDNKADFTDNHTLIYGHNMKDLTMFGKLKYYKTDEDYFPEHKYFQIITNNKKLRYQVFAYKEVEDDSLIYAVYSNSNTDFYKFAKNVISSANQCPEGVVVGYDDRVVTLSTCTDRDDKRFVVCGILIEEMEN